jgi:hypothetical protein
MKCTRKDLPYVIILALVPFVFFVYALTSTTLISTEDAVSFNLGPRVLVAQFWREGRLPLWDEYCFVGFPLLADPQNGALYPFGIGFFLVFMPIVAFNLMTIVHHSLVGLFTYLYARVIRLRRLAAMFAGLSFMFCGFLVAHRRHSSEHESVVWFPLILFFLEKWRRSSHPGYLVGGAVAYALQFLAGYPQVSAYATLVFVFYILWFAIKQKRILRAAGKGAILLLLGVGLAAMLLIPAAELYYFSHRRTLHYQLFLSYNFNPYNLISFIFPYFYGAENPNALYKAPYWGGPWFQHEVMPYCGIAPLIFLLFAIIIRAGPARHRQFWVAAGAIALVLAIGGDTPLSRLLHHIPVYKNLGGHTRYLFIPLFAIALLGAMGLHAILSPCLTEAKRRRMARQLAMVTGLILAVSLIIVLGKALVVRVLGGGFLLPVLARVSMQNRLTSVSYLAQPAIFIPLLLFSGYLMLVLAYFRAKRVRTVGIGIIVLLICDLFLFARFFESGRSDVQWLFQKRDINPVVHFFDAAAKKSKEGGRVFLPFAPIEDLRLVPYPKTNQIVHIPLLNSLNPFIFTELYELTGLHRFGLSWRARLLVQNNTILSALNVKYLVSDKTTEPLVESVLSWNPLYDSGRYLSRELPIALSAWEHRSSEQPGDMDILQASGDGSPDIMQQRVRLSPYTTYRIELEARTLASPYERTLLWCDFYGPGYDSEAQQYIFVIDQTMKPYVAYINSENAPATALVRFYTYSASPLYIRNVRICALPSRPLFSGHMENREALRSQIPVYRKVFEGPGSITIYENRNVCPFAQMVKELVPASGIDDVKAIFFNTRGLFDPHTQAIVAPELLQTTHFSDELATGSVTILKRMAEKIILETKTSGPGFLVVSQQYYPGWKAYIDGGRVQTHHTDGVLTGLFVPAGHHTVELRFEPLSVKLGAALSGITLLVLAAYAVANVGRKRTAFRQGKPGEDSKSR